MSTSTDEPTPRPDDLVVVALGAHHVERLGPDAAATAGNGDAHGTGGKWAHGSIVSAEPAGTAAVRADGIYRVTQGSSRMLR